MKETEWNARYGEEPEPEAPLPDAETSLDYLQSIYRSGAQPRDVRLRAAIAAAPYEHPKLSVSGHANLGIGLAAAIEERMRLQQERERAKGRVIDITPNKASEP
jgi:hypothetical protein